MTVIHNIDNNVYHNLIYLITIYLNETNARLFNKHLLKYIYSTYTIQYLHRYQNDHEQNTKHTNKKIEYNNLLRIIKSSKTATALTRL